MKYLKCKLFICVVLSCSTHTFSKVTVGGFLDVGRVEQSGSLGESEKPFLSRNIAFLDYREKLTHKLEMALNVGFLFWKPSNPDVVNLYQNGGVNEAHFKYHFSQEWNLQMGLMNFKYNSSTKNLGEYLYRSEPYPTLVKTGSWSFLNTAHYQGLGTVLSWSRDNLSQKLLFFMEYYNSPVWDISPSYLIEWNSKAITLGSGISLHRFIANDGKTTNDPIGYITDSLGTYFEEGGERWYLEKVPFKGVKGTLYSSLHLGSLLYGKNNWVLYGEIAVLGVKNYEGVYENVLQRTPVMFGMEIPTWGLLSSLSFEVEYLKNGYRDNLFNVYENVVPLPVGGNVENAYHQDDWKWSVNFSRNLFSSVQLYVQVANDHLRLRDNLGSPSNEPITIRKKDWYWLTRIQFAL